ncbi:hypothetical protein [Chryseobacterium taiwanense]|nr:hypothetical protein [Chryseobacterium taiwanense]
MSSVQMANDTTQRNIHEAYTIIKGDSLIIMEKYSCNLDYRITRTKKRGSRKIITQYYPNYSISSQYSLFAGNYVGVKKDYSEKGELLQTVNYDLLLTECGNCASIFDIAKNIRKDFNVNIENEDEIIGWNIEKSKNLNKTIYKIVCPPKYPDGRPLRGFVYDMKTGKFIEEYKQQRWSY